MKRALIFRVDDVDELSEEFMKLHSLFIEKKVPVVYAIVPEKLSNECSEFIKKEMKRFPGLIDVVQHGFKHENYSKKNEEKYEFGRLRSYEEQKQDILNGSEVMKRIFNDDFLKIFVPPFHGYDKRTIYLIDELGFKGFSSAYNKKVRLNSAMFLSSQFSFDEFSDKDKRILNLKEVIKFYLRSYKKFSKICINLHPDTIFDKFDMLEKFLHFLKKEEEKGKINFANFSDVLKEKSNLRPMELRDLTIELTNRCDLRCGMCNIWMEKEKKDIKLEDIKKLVLSKVFRKPISISLTGGECFLHPDFEEIYRFLYGLEKKGVVSEINIVTNGFGTERINKFFKRNKRMLDGLEIDFSLDGKRKKHNLQRGNECSYDNIIDSIKLAKKYKLKTSAKFTITPVNFTDLLDVYNFCCDKKVYFLPKFAENEVNNYYHRVDFEKNIGLSNKEKEEVKIMLKWIFGKELSKPISKRIVNLVYIKALLRWIDRKKVIDFCCTPLFSLFVSHKGDIFPCLYQKPIANLKGGDWDKKIMGKQHKGMNSSALEYGCPKCVAYHGSLRSYNFE